MLLLYSIWISLHNQFYDKFKEKYDKTVTFIAKNKLKNPWVSVL